MAYLRRFFLFVLFPSFVFAQNHLLVSEFVVSPTAGEFIEIYNPTGSTIDLSDYYITDATNPDSGFYYYNIVTGSGVGGGTLGDFHARFPAGAAISPGEYQTIAMHGANFKNSYPGQTPTYELHDTDPAVPDMREALPGSINTQGGLSNDGEVIILYTWDGQSPLVQDVDYAVWGDKQEAVDKTGVSGYLADTPIQQQISVSSGVPHGSGESVQRFTAEENGEIQSGGNGITGHDETSENLALSFESGPATPNEEPPASDPPVVANVAIAPANPTPTDTVTVTADVTDDGTLVSVYLHYSVNGAAFDSMGMSLVSGDTYQGIIDPQPENAGVNYFIKATDNDTLTTTSPTSSYTVIPPPEIVPIADIQENFPQYQGQVVIVEGVVTLGSGITTTGWTSVYVQDNSGRGINVFRSGVVDPEFVRGNGVRVTGRVDEFNGITEIVDYSVEVLSTGNPIPAPLSLSTSAANNTSLEGTYITFTGEITALSAFPEATNITVNDGSGATAVRVWATTGIDLSGFSAGDSITVKAVMGIFNNAAQYIPGYQDELSIPGALPGDGTGSAVIQPDSVGLSEIVTETITITGTAQYVLESVSVSVPNDWEWVALASNVQLSGSGFAGASVAVNGRVITIHSAAITDLAPGSVQIFSLTSPPYGVITPFPVRTAVAGGSLQPIANSPAVKVGEGAPVGVTPIAQIKNNLSAFLGKEVTIEGIVTLGAGITVTSRTDAYIQDESGRGINVFSFDPPGASTQIARGNRLRLTGTIEEFSGVVEITNFTTEFISAGNPVPDPLFVSTIIANDLTYEGTYMKVSGVAEDIATNVGGGTNITLRDDKGTVLIRVWNVTGINLPFLQTGDTVAVQGVMDIFNNASQLIPGYQDEIIVPGKTARADGSGLAEVSHPVVAALDTLENFSVSIIGVLEEPINALRIDIPKLWQWSGNETDIEFGGTGLENITTEIVLEPFDNVYQVYLLDTEIALEDTAVITFKNLVTPQQALNSVFWVRTAGEGGRLSLIDDMPVVNVAGGTRNLIYDLQVNSAYFSGSVEVQGVTTIGAGLLREVSSAGDSLTTAYIQDESGKGINLFRFGLIQPELVRSNAVRVRGTVTEFNGVTEIEYTQINYIGTVSELPQPVSLSNADVNSTRWDGTLIATAGVILEKFSAGGGTTLEIGDGEGQTNIRIWDTSRLDLSDYNENDRILVQGVGSLFLSNGDSIFQILTAYQDQIQLDPNYAPSLNNVSLNVEPHPFAPDQGERIDITYNAAAVNNRVTIRIFDLGGRLITTILDENAQVIEKTFQWDGRNQLHERVPLGAYICLLEVIEPVSGKKTTKTAPIVVGTILSR